MGAGLAVVHFILLATTVIAGFTQADTANLSPFLLGGTDNMFAAAAVLYFAYAGFDVVATAAEEVGTVQVLSACHDLSAANANELYGLDFVSGCVCGL